MLTGLTTALNVWTPMLTSNPSHRNKGCELATMLHMLNFCEACATICCDCDLWEPIKQVTKKISVLQKKVQSSKQKNVTTTFGKSLFYSLLVTQYRMSYTNYIPPKTKDLVINLTMVVYETGKTQ